MSGVFLTDCVLCVYVCAVRGIARVVKCLVQEFERTGDACQVRFCVACNAKQLHRLEAVNAHTRLHSCFPLALFATAQTNTSTPFNMITHTV